MRRFASRKGAAGLTALSPQSPAPTAPARQGLDSCCGTVACRVSVLRSFSRTSQPCPRSAMVSKVRCLPVLYEQVASRRALRAAWHRVRKRRPVPGADGVTVEIFEAEADTYLEALQAEILDDHYTPQPLRRILLRKEGGGERPVALPSLRDRIVQDALLHALRSPIDRVLGQGAHAYRPGRSAITALEAVQEGLSAGSDWILKGDIATFFDTLDHELLRARLVETLGDDPVVDLVMRCLTGLVLDEMSLWDNRVGTPQGLSLSPLLSNLYMVPFDREMQIAGLNLVRYADDFVVLCATRERADQAERTARDLLAGLRLKPKEEKWSVVSVSDGFVFLGYHFDDRGRGPSRKATEALSWRLESARDDLAKLNPTFEQQVEGFRPIIRGWLGYFETLPPMGPAWDPPMVAAAALEAASSLAVDEASDILTHYVEAAGAALTTFDRLGLAGVAESLGLMWVSLRERARALRAGPQSYDANPQAGTALAQSLGGDEHVEEFLTAAGAFLGTGCGPTPQDAPAEEGAWTLAEFLITRGCQAAAYQMLRATGAGPAPSGPLEDRSTTYPLPPPPATDEDISAFLALFAGHASGYAEEIQTDDGRRVLLYIDAPLDAGAVRQHLGAERTLAVYLCRVEATVTACVLDVDVGKRSLLLHPPGSPDFPRLLQAARTDALALAAALRVHGVASYVEWTGRRGYHVWVFLEEPVPVEAARRALQALLGAVGNPPDGVTREILPNEARPRAGQRGGAVKLPLGVHVQTGDRSSFLDDSGQPVSSPWDHVRAMVRVPASAFLRLVEDCRPPERPRLPQIPKRGVVPEIAATLPDGPVKQVVSGCAAVAFLVEKARRTGYLNHQERVTLLLVLGHVGAEGKAFLEEVMRWCLNYDAAITRKFMRKMFGKPVSCPKLRERHPEVAAGVACECRFPLGRRMYPSPVLHAVAAKEVATGPAEVAAPFAEVAATAVAAPAGEVAAGRVQAATPLRPTQLNRLVKLRFELADLEATVKRCQAQVDELLKTAETGERAAGNRRAGDRATGDPETPIEE